MYLADLWPASRFANDSDGFRQATRNTGPGIMPQKRVRDSGDIDRVTVRFDSVRPGEVFPGSSIGDVWPMTTFDADTGAFLRPAQADLRKAVADRSGMGWLIGDDTTTSTDTTSTDTSGVVVQDYSQSPAQYGVAVVGPSDANTNTATDTSPAVTAPAPAQTTGSFFSDVMTAFTSVAKAAQQIAPAVLSTVQQTQFAAVNTQRAAKGLPPLTAQQYQQQYMLPTATVGLTQATTKSLYYIVGGIAVAVVVGMAFSKRGR